MKNIKIGIFKVLFGCIGTLTALTLMYATVLANDNDSTAQQLPLTFTGTSSASDLTDGSYSTSVTFSAGESLTVSSESGDLYGLYIKWDKSPAEWSLSYEDKTVEYTDQNYLHQYIEIPIGTSSCTITFSATTSICDIYAYSSGTILDDVQVWDPSCDSADILVFSTHADDEILFLGGVLATYAGQDDLNVQVVYMTNYWNGAKIREHEKLDGLWACGVHYYPVNGDFDDLYSTSLEGAMTTYDYDSVLSFVTEQIRRFQPQVCVTQDLNGEYGHGGHMLLASCVQEAVNSSMNADFCPESASTYGTWDVPKTYFHLYAENTIHLDLRTPLSNMSGLTALEVASEAYKQHVSQQWCWFYVSDDYDYSCADFGLYRSTVGVDTSNDMMENVTSYEEQALLAEQAAEAESIAAAEAESSSIAEAESIEAKNIADEESSKKLQQILTIASVLFFFALIIVLGIFCLERLHARRKYNKKK